MAGRSLQLSETGQQQARQALVYQNLTQRAIANDYGICSWATINKFFNGKPVDRFIFQELCTLLNLDWDAVASAPQSLVQASQATASVPSTHDRSTAYTSANPNPSLDVLVHLQNLGDRIYRDGEFAGTRDPWRRLEGFAINFNPKVAGLGIRYFVHLEGVGDTDFATDGAFIGTRRQARRLEGFAIELTGEKAQDFNVIYSAFIGKAVSLAANRDIPIGETETFSNGEFCGTRREGRILSGLRVSVIRKNDGASHLGSGETNE